MASQQVDNLRLAPDTIEKGKRNLALLRALQDVGLELREESQRRRPALRPNRICANAEWQISEPTPPPVTGFRVCTGNLVRIDPATESRNVAGR